MSPSSSSTPPPSPHFALRAVGGGLAAVSMILVNLGCGCSGAELPSWRWGLVEAEVEGSPAEAEAQTTAIGTTVRVLPVARDAHGTVVTIPGRTLDTLPLGEQPIDVELGVCAGDAISACVPARDVVLDVVDLGNGTARASYTGTTITLDGREVPVEGSFVFVRGAGEGI